MGWGECCVPVYCVVRHAPFLRAAWIWDGESFAPYSTTGPVLDHNGIQRVKGGVLAGISEARTDNSAEAEGARRGRAPAGQLPAASDK